MEKKVVLVFDANQRSALASTRALGIREDVEVITCDTTATSLAGNSKFSTRYLQHPDPSNSVNDFVKWVKTTIQQYAVKCLFPVTEISSRTLLQAREELECQLPFAPLETVLSVSDKNRLMALADSLGVPIPKTQYCDTSADVSLEEVQFPCVIKPSLSRVYHDNTWVETQVQFASSYDELKEIFAQSKYLENHPFMLQEMIDGHGAGIFTYYKQGKARAFFAHRRLREKPPRGGVSVLSESAPVDETMRAYSQRLLDAVNWHGAAMIEFRVDKQGIPYLMEINARLWGSLQLAIDAGVNFPQLIVDGEFNRTQESIENFKIGVQLRWLLGDVDNLYLTWKDPDVSFLAKLAHTVKFFVPKLSGRRHEVNRLDDMRPFWFELRKYLGISEKP